MPFVSQRGSGGRLTQEVEGGEESTEEDIVKGTAGDVEEREEGHQTGRV